MRITDHEFRGLMRLCGAEDLDKPTELTTQRIIERAEAKYRQHAEEYTELLELRARCAWLDSQREDALERCRSLAVRCTHMAGERDAAIRERDRLLAKLVEIAGNRPWRKRTVDSLVWIGLQIDPVPLSIGAGAVIGLGLIVFGLWAI